MIAGRRERVHSLGETPRCSSGRPRNDDAMRRSRQRPIAPETGRGRLGVTELSGQPKPSCVAAKQHLHTHHLYSVRERRKEGRKWDGCPRSSTCSVGKSALSDACLICSVDCIRNCLSRGARKGVGAVQPQTFWRRGILLPLHPAEQHTAPTFLTTGWGTKSHYRHLHARRASNAARIGLDCIRPASTMFGKSTLL